MQVCKQLCCCTGRCLLSTDPPCRARLPAAPWCQLVGPGALALAVVQQQLPLPQGRQVCWGPASQQQRSVQEHQSVGIAGQPLIGLAERGHRLLRCRVLVVLEVIQQSLYIFNYICWAWMNIRQQAIHACAMTFSTHRLADIF